MPPGTPYNSFVVPYPIRVDEFTQNKNGIQIIPALHLLTHTHSDHIIGLSARSFGSIVVCSVDSKEMLLRHETYFARFLKEHEYHIERKRTFSHLKCEAPESEELAAFKSYDLLVSS